MYQPNKNESCYTAAFFEALCNTPDIHPNTQKAIDNAICETNREVFNVDQLHRIALVNMTANDDFITAHYYATHSNFFENMSYTHIAYLIESLPVMKAIHRAGTPILSPSSKYASLMLDAILLADNVDTMKKLWTFDNRWLSQHHKKIYLMINTQAPIECLKWFVSLGLRFRKIDTRFFLISHTQRTLDTALFLLQHGTPFTDQRDAIVEAALRGDRLDVAMAFLRAGATLNSTPDKFIQAFFGSPTKALKTLSDDAPTTLIISLIERRIRRSSESLYTLMEKSPTHLKPYFMDVIGKKM